MSLDLRLEVKLAQGLVMTPRLQQAIKLLQLNSLELAQHVQEALLENPTLEVVPEASAEGPDEQVKQLEEAARVSEQDATDVMDPKDNALDWENVLDQLADAAPTPRSLGGTIHDDLPPIETNLTYGESLADHLLFQLTMMKCGEQERMAAECMIHNLDARGYLQMDLHEVMSQQGLDEETVQEGLELLQGLDPLGCGARDLTECLLIQARVLFPEDDNFERILGGHLSHLERRNYAAIAAALDLEQEDVVEYHRMIRELEPRPGRGFAQEDPRYITPDIYVRRDGEDWLVFLNEDGLPELRVSRYYQKVMKGASKEDRDYLLEKLRGAEFLIRSIHKRRKTIVRVMESILQFQRSFFERGPGHLRPLVLQEVADEVGVHMSTVSRVTTNKYVHTTHGTYELKYFFTAGVRQSSGDEMAAEAIRERIRALIGAEDASKPLSDQAISKHLKEAGVSVARRTVAKYREQLGFLSSSMRKKVF